jgi:inward rectifier potassium channel
LGVYLLTNLVFALLYWAAPGSVANLPPGSLMDAFFFSLETLATVGYGYMAPITRYSHIVSAIEIFVGLVLTATMTGLIFVRFSKPRAKILFASHAVVSCSKGVPTLMVRVGNGRLYSLEENHVRMTILLNEIAPNGERFRRLVDLQLARNELPFFPLVWTLSHELSDDSPLAHLRTMAPGELQASGIRLIVSFVARDPQLSAQVYATHSYGVDSIALGMRYADAISGNHDNHSVADMRKISDMTPDTP